MYSRPTAAPIFSLKRASSFLNSSSSSKSSLSRPDSSMFKLQVGMPNETTLGDKKTLTVASSKSALNA